MRRKVTGQSSSTTKPITQSSGISKAVLPRILPSPYLHNLYDIEVNIKNQFMYIIKHYGSEGLAVLIYRQPNNDQVAVACGDWKGNPLDLAIKSDVVKIATDFINKHLVDILTTMKLIKLDQAQLFIAHDGSEHVLVDMQLSANKMAGPGMIRDIFSKLIKTQEVVKIEVIDDKVLDAIKNGSGNYEGDLILKPAKFKLYHDMEANSYSPMYVEIKR